MHSGVVVVSVGAVLLSCLTGCQYQWRRMVPSTCPTGLDGVPDRSTSGFLAGRVGERTESKTSGIYLSCKYQKTKYVQEVILLFTRW